MKKLVALFFLSLTFVQLMGCGLKQFTTTEKDSIEVYLVHLITVTISKNSNRSDRIMIALAEAGLRITGYEQNLLAEGKMEIKVHVLNGNTRQINHLEEELRLVPGVSGIKISRN